jgi:hypothetical protein
MTVIIRDPFSPDLTSSGWELHAVGSSTHGTAGRWGDYSGTAAHETYPNTWIAGGHLQEGGSADMHARPHNLWFMREQDDPGGPPFGTPTPTRTPASPTATPTRTPTATVTPTPSPTRAPVGGRGLTLQAGPDGIRLTWLPGQGQTGYVVYRHSAVPAVLPVLGPLPAEATTFLDPTARFLSGAVCYVLIPTGVDPPVISDVLCVVRNTRSPIGGPQQVAIRLDQSSTATLTWSGPLFGGQTGYQLFPLGDTPTAPLLLPGSATSASVAMNGPTCYLLIVLSGTTAIGTGDIVCGIPGAATVARMS